MRRARWSAFAVAGALVAMLLGPVRAAEPFEIDTILPMTGLLAFAGQTGAETIREVEALVNRTGGIRGRPVHFAIRDDQSSPTVAVQLMNATIARGAKVVLGSMLGADCAAMAALAETRIVHYCISPAIHPPAGSYSFAGGPATEGASISYARYMRARGWTAIALLASTDASGQDLDASFMTAMNLPENRDLKLVVHEHFNTADISVSALVARVKASGAQAVVVYTSGSAFGTILRNIKDVGLDIPVFTTSSNETMSFLRQLTDAMPNQIYFPAYPVLAGRSRNRQEHEVQERFLSAQKAAGVVPDSPSVASWDPAVILVEAYRALGTDATAQQIHDWIENLHGYYGVYGVYDFRSVPQRGVLSVENTVVVRWDPAKTYWTPVSDFGGLPLHH